MPAPASPPSDKAPSVSVIVAVYNVRDQVAEAIASLRAQSHTDFEALVVDDGSTDGSGAIAMAAACGDPRFRLIRQDNAGLSAARNAGLEAARGTFVAFLDGDDAFAPGFLSGLLAAIARDGTDWAASAISLCYPDGRSDPHPALHGEVGGRAAHTLDLGDARTAARVFPSAWNKLFRRSVFGDLRFPPGTWFEDHEVFWACAARRPKLAYVPEPLYRHRRDRPGQITGTDSDRVFEQFTVLDRLRPLILAGGFRHAEDGFARLATRLVHERAMVLRTRDRRARFLAEAQARFDTWGLRYAPDWDLTISRGLGMAMEGVLPLSVVVIAGEGGSLEATLKALDQQSMADFDLHVLAPADLHVPERLVSGLRVGRMPGDLPLRELPGRLAGASVVLYAPGERPAPDGLLWLVNLIDRTGASLAFGRFNRARAGYHDGWTDNTVVSTDLNAMPTLGALLDIPPEVALRIYPALGNRIFGKALLARLPGTVSALEDAGSVQALVLGAAVLAGRAGFTRMLVAEGPDAPAGIAGLATLADWARDLPDPDGPPLPRGWRGVLFLRLARLRGAGLLRMVALSWRAGFLRGAPGAGPDPENGWVLRKIWFLLRIRRG
ncbi:MAG: glycosyltransferase family 2 protein [Rhodobacteraceae bacterium]|jgi:glycosyltransferase involved in cell wall biosynthesis|nr:glycosyltransferase family 2 protein [Paracoccaceae bacterium]